MSANRSIKRLASGVTLLVMIAAVALMASSSAFAFSLATDQPSTTANGGPTNGAGVVSVLTLNVASVETVIASYSAPSANTGAGQSLAVGTFTAQTSAATTIRTMYQQWRHLQQNDWFYIYAQNAATSVSNPVFDYYYYTPMRGVTRVNRTASAPNGTTVVSGGGGSLALNPSFVYLTTGTAVPAFGIESIGATVPGTCVSATGAACSGINFTVSLRWGLAQQGFRDEGGSGTFILQQAVESFPIATATTPTLTVYYDAWEPVTQSDSSSTVALGDAAPTQSATGVSNASGARNVNTASAYSSVQTVRDQDADLNSGQLVWVFTSGTQTGQWFQAGVYLERDTGGYNIAPTGGVFYQSWNEARVNTTPGSQITTNYFNSLTVSISATQSATGGGTGVNTMDLTYNYIYSTNARGTVSIIGRAEDWHGRSSGNVTVGSQTIT